MTMKMFYRDRNRVKVDKRTIKHISNRIFSKDINWIHILKTHSSTLAWKIPWMEESGRLQSMGSHQSDMTEWLHFFHFSFQRLMELYKTLMVAQMVKNLPAVQETQVPSLGWEHPLEKEMAIHSSILTWKILWTEEPGELQSMESQRAGHDWVTNMQWIRKLITESVIET